MPVGFYWLTYETSLFFLLNGRWGWVYLRDYWRLCRIASVLFIEATVDARASLFSCLTEKKALFVRFSPLIFLFLACIRLLIRMGSKVVLVKSLTAFKIEFYCVVLSLCWVEEWKVFEWNFIWAWLSWLIDCAFSSLMSLICESASTEHNLVMPSIDYFISSTSRRWLLNFSLNSFNCSISKNWL